MDEKDYKLSPEYRKLLAKDLYQRLGTGTLVQDMQYFGTKIEMRPTSIWLVDTLTEEVKLFADEPWQPIYSVRPYLRPMSSMTEEEYENFRKTFKWLDESIFEWTYESYDWLNEHHFDFRGLIPMGLALEAKEGMYGKE